MRQQRRIRLRRRTHLHLLALALFFGLPLSILVFLVSMSAWSAIETSFHLRYEPAASPHRPDER